MRTQKGALYWGVRVVLLVLALAGIAYWFWWLPARPHAITVEFVP